MKCTNCGKNNASYHIRTTINGETTEQHLCPACAAELQPERAFAARTGELLGDLGQTVRGFFDDGFFGGGLFDDGFFGGFPGGGLLDGFFPPVVGFFPAVLAPRVRVAPRREENAAPAQEPGQAVDPELARQREINALREQMRAAAEAEEYEKAAGLRDQLKKLENGR